MRIIAGKLKGRSINLPKNLKLRPTTDFAKEALFSILNNEYEYEGLKVLDLFSGTGSISYEFASRGAGHIWSVEMNPIHVNVIRRESSRLGISNITALHQNVFDFLGICKEKFDLVFADPPYDLVGLEKIVDKVFENDILQDSAYFILEHGDEYNFSGHPYFVKEKQYGRVHFSFFEKK